MIDPVSLSVYAAANSRLRQIKARSAFACNPSRTFTQVQLKEECHAGKCRDRRPVCTDGCWIGSGRIRVPGRPANSGMALGRIDGAGDAGDGVLPELPALYRPEIFDRRSSQWIGGFATTGVTEIAIGRFRSVQRMALEQACGGFDHSVAVLEKPIAVTAN